MSEAVHAHFEVTRAKNAGQKDNPHGGQFDKWYVGLKNLDGGIDCDDAYWQRKAPSEVETQDRVYGKLEKGDYGWRFFMEKEPDGAPAGGGGGGGSERSSGGGSKGKWEPESSRDPERSARILRQHSQSCAVEVLTAMGTFEGKSADQIHTRIREWTDWLDADVEKAGQAARQGPGSGVVGEQSPAAPAVSEPAPASPPADTHQFFSHLLQSAAVNPEAAHVLAEYIVNKFSDQQRKKAETGLLDMETQPDTVKKLEAAYEETEKRSLPGREDLDDVPF